MSFKFGEGKSEGAMLFKKFESADEIEEKKKQRQEEWEKVRRPDQPLTAPEEVYDHRSLYDRLQEQKQKAQDEYEDKHRLSNQVKGLDDDEAAFLDLVCDRQMELDNQRKKEEEQALAEYRKALATRTSDAGEKSTEKKASKNQTSSSKQSSKKSQHELLKGAVKRKRSDTTEDEKKPKLTDDNAIETGQSDTNTSQASTNHHSNHIKAVTVWSQTMRVGGVLPGLCQYNDSTSDSNSSSSDSDDLEDETKTMPKLPKLQHHSHSEHH